MAVDGAMSMPNWHRAVPQRQAAPTGAGWLDRLVRGAAWLACGIALAWPGATVAADPAQSAEGPLPIALFYRPPDLGQAALSPSGRFLAVTLSREGRMGLAVLDLDGSAPPRLLVRYDNVDVNRFFWVGEERLVYDVVDRASTSGPQNFGSGLYMVEANGQGGRLLIKHHWEWIVRDNPVGRQPLGVGHSLLALPEDGSDEVIVGKRTYDANWNPKEVIPLRLNVRTLQTRSIGEGMPDGMLYWQFDRAGEPRVAMGVQGGQLSVFWREPKSQAWRQLASMSNNARPWNVHSVGPNGELFVTLTEGADNAGVLRRFDFATGKPAKGDPLVRVPGFSVQAAWLRDSSGPNLGLLVVSDAETTVWFDAGLKRFQEQADQQFPGRINRITCRRCTGDDPVLLVRSWSDRQPDELWLFRPKRDSGQWKLVGRSRPDVDPRRMATLDFHRITARDGLSLPVWLTLPAGADAKTRRPAVVLVHGGPWLRGGYWGWRGEAQFLASRGYVVIEPEFRGSEGYGARLFQAGRRQWGRAMQDDLADALQWAVAQGWVDAERVCIAGGSYGGYAALMGPVRHPGLYRCAAAWIAVTDPRLLFGLRGWSNTSDESRDYALPELIGDPVKDADMLADAAPITHAAALKVPVFLAYGGRDAYVPLQHGERMREALIAAGNPPEWRLYAEEGHGFAVQANQIDFAQRLEVFLAKHLRPGADPAR